jgi:hypothetical protein
MNIGKKPSTYILIFLSFYISLIIGFMLGEDSAGGAITDYNVHLNVREFFLKDTLYGLINYLEVTAIGGGHSPVFIIFLKYLLMSNETLGRLIFLNLCVLIPLLFCFTLKKKIEVKFLPIFFLSNLFFLSPYFRSTAIWPGDENLAILFFIISIYFYVSFSKTAEQNLRIRSMILNIVFLALASYFRPIYALFSLFFFYEIILKNFKINYFIIYIFTNLIFALPALYYVFILKVTFFYNTVGSFNLINSISLTYTVLLFFLIPFIFLTGNYRSLFKINRINIFVTIFFSIIVYKFFNYQMSTGGGLFFQIQKLFFNENFFFTFIFAISFYLVNNTLEVRKIKNLILLLILLFFELDNYFYMETFDPLFLICFLLLFDVKILSNFFNKDMVKKTSILFSYLSIFYLAKVIYIYL